MRSVRFDEEVEKTLAEETKNNLNIDTNFSEIRKISSFNIEDVKSHIKNLSDLHIGKKKAEYGNEVFSMAEKSLLIQIIDQSWREHLLSLDHLRQGISLRAYGQRDPLNEYKQEAFVMFEDMMSQIRLNVSRLISFIEIRNEVNHNDDTSIYEGSNVSKKSPNKIARNAKCPCGSGKKYKNCCGKF